MAWPDDEIMALREKVRKLEAHVLLLETCGTPRGIDCDHRGNCIVKPEDEVFEERIGCLDCNQWLSPVRMKRR